MINLFIENIFPLSFALFLYFSYNTLLLQIDSMDDEKGNVQTIWGDAGVCNFFINKDKLKNLDFSDILYNWDCC